MAWLLFIRFYAGTKDVALVFAVSLLSGFNYCNNDSRYYLDRHENLQGQGWKLLTTDGACYRNKARFSDIALRIEAEMWFLNFCTINFYNRCRR